MEGMKDFIVSVIERGGYKLDDIEIKIKRMYIIGDITESEMTELLQLAADSVDNSAQIDLFQKIIDLEHRVEALETADFVEWKPGYITKKGEIVKFDLNGDGVLDYVMYYGGRTETSLGVGKINGWYKVTSDGTKTHTVTRNSDGTYTLTPL